MKVFFVGDSTVCNYSNELDRYIPRHGYGMHVGDYLKSVDVCNLALSGRSSRSFLNEPEYEKLLADLSAGDFLVIGFGHNDEKHDERYTNPNEDISVPTSFKYHLYNYYIKVAEDRGAKVVICTPICRLSKEKVYSGHSVHIEDDYESFEGGNYPQTIRNLASELSLPLVDMTNLTKEVYENLGYEKAKLFHATNTLDVNDIDGTHLNNYGASYLAYLFVKGLKNTDSPLKNYIKEEISLPLQQIFHN